jgi:Fe-S-cluster containining protein
MPTLCLTLHAGYACRHTGACCQTWTVAADTRVMHLVASGHVLPASSISPLFVRAKHGSEAGWTIARKTSGDCVFFNRDGERLCAIHEAAGVDALPTACRHFPRVVLRDARGILLSLSHFCPTAAALLLAPTPLAVVDAGDRLRLEEPVEGLDGRDALPPLVRPGLLSDLEGYDAWERACIATFARRDLGWQQALDLIAAATEQVRRWEPGTRSLRSQVENAFAHARHEHCNDPQAQSRARETVRSFTGAPACGELPEIDDYALESEGLPNARDESFDRAMRNYLAARVFGNWIAYQGRGLRSIVEWLRTCAAAVRHHAMQRAIGSAAAIPREFLESFRAADLLLLHTIDTQAFARRAMALEGPDPR